MCSGGQREASGFFGIPTAVVKEFLAPLEKGEEPQFNMLGVRCEYLSLPQLRGMGLGDELAHKIEAQENRKAVVVGQTFYSAPVNMLFKDGDVILSLNGASARARMCPACARGRITCLESVLFRYICPHDRANAAQKPLAELSCRNERLCPAEVLSFQPHQSQ